MPFVRIFLLILLLLQRTAFAASSAEVLGTAYDNGDYRRVAIEGARELARDPAQAALRLKVANSLAWTGRYDAAIAQYEKLLGSDLDASARVGIGNVMRWRGMPDVASAYFKEALARAPGDADVKLAQKFLDRDLRPALTVRLADSADNSNYSRRDLSVDLRYWTEDRRLRGDLGAVLGGDKYLGSTVDFRALRAGLAAPGLWAAPKVELAYHQAQRSRWFGTVEVEPLRRTAPELLVLRGGVVDYARLAFNNRAPAAGLRAGYVGARSRIESSIGNLTARADLYRISDQNRVVDGELKFTSYWQPLPWGVKVDLGLSGRKANQASANYWSPDKLYALGTAGLRKAWYWDDGELTLGLQQGFKLTDEARNNLSVSAGGKYWLDPDFALGFELWWSKSPRPNDYRTRYLGISLQHNF